MGFWAFRGVFKRFSPMVYETTETPSGRGWRTESDAGAASTERLLTTEDVAVVLKVSVRTVERMRTTGRITPVRLRGSLVAGSGWMM